MKTQPASSERTASRLVLASFAAALFAARADAGGVRIVEPTGTQNFADIQAAVDAAVDGDILLVGEGSYPGFTIDGKGVFVTAASTGLVQVQGTILITNLTSHEVILNGLNVLYAGPALEAPALRLFNNTGHVLVQGCTFAGYTIPPSGPSCPCGASAAAIEVVSSTGVSFVACSAFGADGFSLTPGGTEGGPGLESIASTVALYDCTLIGGRGGNEGTFVSNDGGDGYSGEQTSSVFASGCVMRGGNGGHAPTCETNGGGGGHGLSIQGGRADLLDNVLEGGLQGSIPQPGCAVQGPPGLPLFSPGAVVTSFTGVRRSFVRAQAVQSDASIGTLTVRGAPGDRVFFPKARLLDYVPAPTHSGVWLIQVPDLALALGNIPLNGAPLVVLIGLPDVPLPLSARRVLAQGVMKDVAGLRFLGSPSALALLNRNAPPDCNGNGVQDYIDVIEGLAPDANHNLIPDTCPGG